jgi:hypothetical protein
VGVFLLTPPVILILQSWSEASGFPLFIAYIFVCWVLLIVAGGILSTRLARLEEEPAGEGGVVRRGEARD